MYKKPSPLRIIIFLGFLLYSFDAISQVPGDRNAVSPKEIDSVLINPGIGFNTFQRFNGDTLFPGAGWREGYPIIYQDFKGSMDNKNYPQTTIAYWRVYWKFMEPEKQKYRWDLLDQALDSARRRGQKLLLRIAPYGSDPSVDVPDWYRKIVGPKRDFKYNNPVNKWLVDPEDPLYAEYFGGFIRELGKRYDGHPDLESVDLSIVGAWGEGAGSELLTQHTMEALIDAYADPFKETPLILLMMDAKTHKYANAKVAHPGWRVDCIGDLGFWAAEQNGFTHMYDFYPQSIIEYGLQDAWKKAPLSFEICGTMLRWRDEEKYSAEQVKYIFDQTLKWHISSFNAKSSPVPREWEPLVDDWLKKMGYRFVLRRFNYPKIIGRNRKLDFQSWWENAGVAPCYLSYPLAIRLKSTARRVMLNTNADIRTWLPGDNIYNDAVFIPADLPSGEYDLEIAIIEKLSQLDSTPKPIVKLAIEGITKDGWYSIGKINVQ